jgi:hypothetical protein
MPVSLGQAYGDEVPQCRLLIRLRERETEQGVAESTAQYWRSGCLVGAVHDWRLA